MAESNFLLFNEANNETRTYNDSEYLNATQRQTGVVPGMALSRMHNKMYYQWSAMCKAIADGLVAAGYDCKDSDVAGITTAFQKWLDSAGADGIAIHNANASAHPALVAQIEKGGMAFLLRQESTTYEVGDVVYSPLLKRYQRLECVVGGTSNVGALNVSSSTTGG